jgi:ribosome recycling factor
MSLKEIESHAKQKMDKVLADMQHALASVRTGRASVSMLDGLRIDYYGTPTPISQVATLLVPEAGMITAQPWDVSQIGQIEKAIRTSDLGLNPQNDGKIIRIPIPPLTTERRKEMVKHLHHVAEEHRVALRSVRRDANDAAKKLLREKTISEDDEKRSLADIQKLTDAAMGKLDAASQTKEKELMSL